MFSSRELKKKALLSLKTNWGTPLLLTLLFILITGAIASLVSIVFLFFSIFLGFILVFFIDIEIVALITQGSHYILSFAANLIIVPLSLGYINCFLMFIKHQKPEISNLFDAFLCFWRNVVIFVDEIIGIWN